MIKNIVFDMGKVLLNYDEHVVCHHVTEDETMQKSIAAAVFQSQEWILLDMGVITEKEALKRMQARLETEEEKELASYCLAHWHEYNMWSMDGMGELVRKLKEKSFGIYLLSNASLRLLDCYRMIPGIEYFDGTLFSAEVKCIKPQKEIYGHFFERFHLKPEECFFIDDSPLNIEGSRACGMDGYCFADGDRKRLEKCLFHLNED